MSGSWASNKKSYLGITGAEFQLSPLKGRFFPFSVIESLKSGVPVVVSNCGDVREIIIDGWNGFIIEDFMDDVPMSQFRG